MATRFYFEPTIAAPVTTQAFDGGWEQNGQAVRRYLRHKQSGVSVATALANSTAITVPTTTTQDYLCYQFVSDPIPAQRLTGTFSFVMRCLESANAANVTLGLVLKIISQDGATLVGTLISNFSINATEFPITTAATRSVSATAITAVTTNPGDRICLEVGGHGAAPGSGQTYTLRSGFSAASDLAYTDAVTTDNNPSCEFSQDIWGYQNLEYQQIGRSTGAGVSINVR